MLSDEAGASRSRDASTNNLTVEHRLLATVFTAIPALAEQAFNALMEPYKRELTSYVAMRLNGRHELARDALQEMRRRVWQRLRGRPFELQGGKKFGAFLQRIIENVVIDTLRYERGNVSLDYLMGQYPDQFCERGADMSPAPGLSTNDMNQLQQPAAWEDHLSQSDIGNMSLQQLSTDTAQSERFLALFPTASAETAARKGGGITDDIERDGRSHVMRATARLRQPRRDCFHLDYVWGLKHAEIGELVGLTVKQVTDHIYEAKEQVRALLSYLWWEEEGYSESQIAVELNADLMRIAQYVERGRRLYTQVEEQRGHLK